MRRLGDRDVEPLAGAGVAVAIVDHRGALVEQPAQPGEIGVGRIFRREFRRQRLDGALRVHDFLHRGAGEIELHRERVGEQARIAARHPRAAARLRP